MQPRRLTAGVGLVGAVAAVVVQVAGPGDGDAAATGAGVLVGRAGASWRPVTANSQVSDPPWCKKKKSGIFPELIIAGKASYTVALSIFPELNKGVLTCIRNCCIKFIGF